MEILQNKKDNNSNSINLIISRYLPYWPLFLILMAVSFVIAYGYLKWATPVYEADARILIKDEKKGSDESKTVESLDQISQNKIIENETEIIGSRTNLMEVVNNLGLYATISQKQTFKEVAAYITSPVNILVQNTNNIYVTKQPVPFTYDLKSNEVVIGNKNYGLNSWVNTQYGILKFVKNKYFKQGTDITNLSYSLTSVKDAANAISQGLTVASNDKESTILNLTYSDEAPQRAADILNQILFVYNNKSALDKNTLAASTLKFLDDRLAKVSKSLDSIEKESQRYKSSSNASDISTQGRLYLENVSSNDQKLSNITTQLSVLNQVQSYVESNNNTSAIVPSTFGVNDQGLSQMIDKYYSAQLEYQNQKSTSGENNPLTIAAKDQVEKMRPDIMENLKTLKSNLAASRNDLAATNNSYSSALSTVPEKERQLININRDQAIKTETYNFLLQKREEAALSLASTNANSQVIDQADYSDIPVSPKKKLVYLSALLGSIIIGSGFIYGKESFSNKIIFRQEIETLTAQPIVGEIIAEPTKNTIITIPNQRTFIAEQFRKLRTTLNYLGINADKKRILITSAVSGDGKSFVAANLALSLAIAGKRVVLVDFDLINPSLSNNINVHEQPGLVDYMLDKADINDIIYKTDLHDNLWIVPAGALVENSTELLMTEKVESVLNYLSAHYDYVVIDSAPVTPVTDAYILSPFCDATLFIIRHGYTPKIFVSRIDENNKINKLTNVGIVFNGIKSRGFTGKNYSYGYGYTYNNNKKKKS